MDSSGTRRKTVQNGWPLNGPTDTICVQLGGHGRRLDDVCSWRLLPEALLAAFSLLVTLNGDGDAQPEWFLTTVARTGFQALIPITAAASSRRCCVWTTGGRCEYFVRRIKSLQEIETKRP